MPPKGSTKDKPPSTPQQPANVGLEITRKIGERERTQIIDAPVIVKENAGHTGTGKIMEIRPTPVTQKVLQPFLNKEEAEQLGLQKWHLYAYKITDNEGVTHKKQTVWTCVVNERRFFIPQEIYADLPKLN